MKTAEGGSSRASSATQWPEVRQITLADIIEVLAAGLRDFRAAPLYSLSFGAIYAVGGWILVLLLLYMDLPYLVYPLAMGFALIAPFVATGLYAISHSLERDQPPSWNVLLGSVRRASGSDLGWMALVTGFSLFIWIDIAGIIFLGFFGFSSFNVPDLLAQVFTTGTGLVFLLVGNTVGAVLAMIVFSFSVVSFPMLFDRNVDFVTAMVTSVKVVLENPKSMIVWCGIIAVLIAGSLLSALVGMFIVLPVLGHASWHLYRRAVGPPPGA
jgi:uncharacterized membrane protein